MYYDDEARRFNVLSGLLFGTVLGAGLALLASPQKGVRIHRRATRATRKLKRRSGRAAWAVGGVVEPVMDRLSDAWERSAPRRR